MKALLVAALALLAPLATATERPPLPACPSGNFTPFISKGCYSDDGSKALDFRSPSSQYSMTVEQCTAECKGNGYRYAGLKYYGVCYCGSSLSAAKVDDSQCSLACSGDKKEVCGGNTQLSVWEDPTFAKCGSDITINDYESLGCHDDDGSSEGRALNHKLDLDANTFTAKLCLDACRVRGYAYAGTENGNECWCGTNVGSKNIKVDDAKCDMPCQGGPSGKCGGRSVIDLYHAKKLESGEPCSGSNTQAPAPSSTATRTRTRRCSRRPLTSTSLAQSSPSTPATTPSQESSTPIPSATSQESASSSTIVPSGVSTTEPCTDNIPSSTLAASTTPQGSSTPGSSTPGASIPGTSTAGTSTAGTSTPAPSTTQVSSTEPCSDDISSTVTPSSTPSSAVSTTSALATSTSQPSSSTTPSTSPSSTTVPSTTAGAGSTSIPGTTTVPTTTQRPSTTSTQPMCTATHTQPATCEFKCGNWCAPALPDWKDKNSCLNAAKTCSLQIASCFKTAGWPKAIECFDFSKWCGQVEEYCHSDCPSGNCGKTDCWNKRKPSGSNGTPPTVSTTVYPCPATSTMATSVARPSTTSHCAPTPTNICKQPTNTDWGYGPGKPVAGVPLPVVGCNDNKKDWKSNPFKFYNHPDSRSCQSFPWNQRPNVCADACQEQYEDCVDTYVQSCNDQSWRNGKNHKRTNDNGGCAASNTGSEWRKSGCDKVHCWGQGGNDGNTAQKRCKAQYQDCLAINKNMQPSNQCQSWCDAKSN
ncbi:unnamed protein product [Clonostachys solani]|uniref:WSC domain-containing protein n=1 Tax=Clonostachys solani TaxID=160281 RepID=A0A9N9ZNU8_9HYPO|nr:unnamed protein product [Clonostachys solani]